MKTYLKYFLISLLINFGGLAIGGLWTNPGTSSEWYTTLNQAPWTPDGWVFGFAWTLIGITFSIWTAYVWKNLNSGDYETPVLFVEAWLLNLLWNPLFFGLHWVKMAGIFILMLLISILALGNNTYKYYGWKPVLLLLPYIIWLVIANSLNWYIIFMN